jgi:hypothetical protein
MRKPPPAETSGGFLVFERSGREGEVAKGEMQVPRLGFPALKKQRASPPSLGMTASEERKR